jgi:hypothetical protein
MAYPPAIDIIAVALATVGVASADLAAAIATVQAVAAPHERVVGVVVAAGTTAGAAMASRPHPSVGLPFFASAPAGAAAGTIGPLATAAVAGAPAWPSFNPAMGGASYWSTPHALFMAPQYGFLMQQVEPVVGAAGTLAAAATVGTPTGTAASAPAWPPFFDPSMGGAPYWLTPHTFFAAPQYGFPV